MITPHPPPYDPKPTNAKIIQICTLNDGLVGLDNRGRIWVYTPRDGWELEDKGIKDE